MHTEYDRNSKKKKKDEKNKNRGKNGLMFLKIT